MSGDADARAAQDLADLFEEGKAMRSDDDIRTEIRPILAELQTLDDVEDTHLMASVVNVVAELAADRAALIADRAALIAERDQWKQRALDSEEQYRLYGEMTGL